MFDHTLDMLVLAHKTVCHMHKFEIQNDFHFIAESF